jgi:hypothetical protein
MLASERDDVNLRKKAVDIHGTAFTAAFGQDGG